MAYKKKPEEELNKAETALLALAIVAIIIVVSITVVAV